MSEQFKSIEITELTRIANAIRTKTGTTDKISLEDMPAKIAAIESAGGGSVETCTVTLNCDSTKFAFRILRANVISNNEINFMECDIGKVYKYSVENVVSNSFFCVLVQRTNSGIMPSYYCNGCSVADIRYDGVHMMIILKITAKNGETATLNVNYMDLYNIL